MKKVHIQQVQKSDDNYRVARPKQTGFSSPATHYNEPRIDLNDVLVNNANATFYIRLVDDSYQELGIDKHDVLIVDKSMIPKNNQLAVVVKEGEFVIIRMTGNSLEELTIWGVITYVIKSTS